jgi:hypothetical protein
MGRGSSEGDYWLTTYMKRYLATNPKDASDIDAKPGSNHGHVVLLSGQTKEFKKETIDWLKYTYQFLAFSEDEQLLKKETKKVEKEVEEDDEDEEMESKPKKDNKEDSDKKEKGKSKKKVN